MKKVKSIKTKWAKLRREQSENIPIDYDKDAPKTSAAFWKDAKVVIQPHKIHISMRSDDDIIEQHYLEGHDHEKTI